MLLNRKGITPIIAIILLLMMTIAISGLAYVFIQRYQAGVATATENTTATAQQALKVNLQIDGYNTTCGSASSWTLVRLYIRNAGTDSAKNVQLFIDNTRINGSFNTTLNAGTYTSYLLPNESCLFWINRSRTVKLSSDEQEVGRLITFYCPINQSC